MQPDHVDRLGPQVPVSTAEAGGAGDGSTIWLSLSGALVRDEAADPECAVRRQGALMAFTDGPIERRDQPIDDSRTYLLNRLQPPGGHLR